MTPSPVDERAHTPGPAAGWSDAWHLDAATDDGIGLTVRLECFPNRGRAHFWTYLVLPDLSGPVVVRDDDVPLPRQGVEIRAEGLWSDLWCETPLEHWTYGLEAFAVRLDNPEDALTGEIGERIAIGLDIEWEIGRPLHAHPESWPLAGYVIPGPVHGEVLLGRERFELDARGEYHRTWGDRDAFVARLPWSRAGWNGDIALHAEGTEAGLLDGFGGPAPLEVEVLARAPVPLDGGFVADRALCRMTAADTTLHGWTSATRRA